MKKNLFLVFLSPVIIFVLFEIFCFHPNWLVFCMALVFLLVVVSVKNVVGGRFLSLDFWATVFLPLLFSFSAVAYSLITPTAIVRQAIFVLIAVFFFLYLNNIGKEERHVSIENIFSYASFLLLFFSFSFFYGLRVVLGISIVVPIVLATVLTILVLFEIFWANRISIKIALVYIFLASLLIMQLSWSLYFLSLSHNFSGLILAVCCYVLIGIIKPYLRGSLTKKTVKVYLICGFSSIVVLLLSAQWL